MSALDDAVLNAVASLARALAQERTDINAHLEQHHQELTEGLDKELRRGLGLYVPAPVDEALWTTPSRDSEASSRRLQLISPQFAGDWPINVDEDIGKLGGQKNREEVQDQWRWLRGCSTQHCCTPQKAHGTLPWQPGMTPPRTPLAAVASRWKPSSAKRDSAVFQVLAPPCEETQAEEFYRETMESLKDPLLQKKVTMVSAEQMSPLQKQLDAIHFDVVVGVVILVNSVFIGYSTEYSVRHFRTPNHNIFINIGEWLFLIFFMVELGLRMYIEGCYSFCVGKNCTWNGFDFFLIGTSLLSQMLEMMQMGSGTMKTSTSLRALRLAKMVRMLRVLRGAHMMHELRALLSSIGSSCRILFWAMIMMLFIYYTFGLVFMNAVAVALPDSDEVFANKLLKYYGTVKRTMLTLFMSTTGGMDWSLAADVLWPIGGFYYTLFLFYVSVVSFAIVNLITGLFVDGAMKAAEKDRIVEMQDVKTESDEFKEAVKQLFEEMVKDDDGILDREELAIAIQDKRMKAFMEWVQYDTNEIITLFRILDKAGGSKGVTFDFFVDSCFRFGQRTKGLDLLILLEEQEKVQKATTQMQKSISEITGNMARIEQAISSRSEVQPQRGMRER